MRMSVCDESLLARTIGTWTSYFIPNKINPTLFINQLLSNEIFEKLFRGMLTDAEILVGQVIRALESRSVTDIPVALSSELATLFRTSGSLLRELSRVASSRKNWKDVPSDLASDIAGATATAYSILYVGLREMEDRKHSLLLREGPVRQSAENAWTSCVKLGEFPADGLNTEILRSLALTTDDCVRRLREVVPQP